MNEREVDKFWRDYASAYDFFNPPTLVDVHEKAAAFIGKEKDVIDLGCGVGKLLPHLQSPRKYLGIDGSPQMIDIAKRKYSTRDVSSFRLGDVTNIETPNESFDASAMINVLYSLSEEEKAILALKNANRVLRKGGLLAVTMFNSGFSQETLLDKIQNECFEQAQREGREDMYRTFVDCNLKLTSDANEEYKPLLLDEKDMGTMLRETGLVPVSDSQKIFGGMGEIYFVSKD